METENDVRAGGSAQSKDVDDVPERESGGESQTTDAAGRQEADRAGGSAQSKGVS